MAKSSWWRFRAYNTESRYGYGTPQEADRYCDYLNRDREINHYAAELLDDPEIEAALEAGDRSDGCNLDEELIAIAQGD